MTTPDPMWQPYYRPVVLPSHPRAKTALILGLVGVAGFFVLLVPVLVSPLAWYFGATARREVDRDPTRWGGRGEAQAGMVLGIIGTVLLALAILMLMLTVAGLALLLTLDSGYGS